MAWLNLNREDRDSKENRARHEEVVWKRLNRVLSSGNSVEGAHPKEVEARIRNSCRTGRIASSESSGG